MSGLIGVQLTSVDSTAQFAEGLIDQHYDGKVYKYVKVRNETATVAGEAGDVVGYLGSPSATESNTVVTDNTDAATKPVGAGVYSLMLLVSSDSYFCWCRSRPFTAIRSSGSPADGDALFLSTTDKTLTLATAADDPVCAYAIDDSADKCMAAFAF